MNGYRAIAAQAGGKSVSVNRATTTRLYYLDWFRVAAILIVFFVHCSKIFDYHTTVVFNAVRSPVLTAFRDFSLLWIMPLFFVLSGAAVFLSGKFDDKGGFLKTRILRLLIPLIFMGTIIINPLYVYIERLSSSATTAGFFQWYPQYFNGIYGFGGNFAPLGQGTHLWYLEFLFVFSLILLPLFVRSKTKGTSFLSRISRHFEHPVALLLMFVPISLVAAGFESVGLGGARVMGGWDPISYLLFFGYGYLIYSNENIGKTLGRYAPMFIAVAVFLTVFFISSHFGFPFQISGLTRHDLLNNGAFLPANQSLQVGVQALRGLIGWCWVIGFLGLGSRMLNFSNKFLSYANEGVLPFYMLHHSIIYIVGYYIIQWHGNVTAKFILIASISFVLIVVLYAFVIRQFDMLRYLFGMKMRVENKGLQFALSALSGLIFVSVVAVLILSVKGGNISPPPTKPGLYVNDTIGFQLTFLADMNKPGKLSSSDMLFHIRHPEKNMFIKVRRNATPQDQPLVAGNAKKWIKDIMINLGMKNPQIVSVEPFLTSDGTKALCASTKFNTKTKPLFGIFTFADRDGTRLFIAEYNDEGIEPLTQTMDTLIFH